MGVVLVLAAWAMVTGLAPAETVVAWKISAFTQSVTTKISFAWKLRRLFAIWMFALLGVPGVMTFAPVVEKD